MMSKIKKILKDEQVEIYLQPIVSIRTKSIYAYEALTRCTYKEKNISPDILFSLASKENLNNELDELTRRIAIKKFHKYYKKNNNLLLFLNFESDFINNFIKNDNFIKLILSLKMPFKNFVLEIKEDEINNTEAINSFCLKYKDLGFSIALDDFGTGSSNFHRLNLIRPDIIKIDKSLFRDVRNNKINKEVVKAISKMCNNLGIVALAEGVEDEDSICLGMKCLINLYQGYYFCKAKEKITKKINTSIVEKIIEIAEIFKAKRIENINFKTQLINQFNLISNKIITEINNVQNFSLIISPLFKNYKNIEAIYLIEQSTSKQVGETIINLDNNKFFKASKEGDEHYLKEYYYITLESKRGIYLSPNYISYASGSICKTFAKKFVIKNIAYILCLDIVIKGDK